MPVRSRGRGRGRGGAAGRERAGGQARANEPGRAPGSPRAIERRWHGCEAGKAEPKDGAGRRRGPSAARGEPSGRASRARRERGALARSRRPELRGGGGHNFVCACLGVRAWNVRAPAGRAGERDPLPPTAVPGPGKVSWSRRVRARCSPTREENEWREWARSPLRRMPGELPERPGKSSVRMNG